MTRSDALNSPHHPLRLSWLILFIIIILRELFVLFLFYVTKLTPVLSKQCIYKLWDLIVNVDSNNTLSQSLVIKYFPYIPFYPLFTYSEWNFISYCSYSGVQISSWAQSLQRNRVLIPAPAFLCGVACTPCAYCTWLFSGYPSFSQIS